MAKEKKKKILIDINLNLLDKIKISAIENSEGIVNREIRRLIKKSLENDRN